MTIWLDTEDLFLHAQSAHRPSGIQRLSFEIYKALQAAAPEGVRFVRHDSTAKTLRIINWADIAAQYSRLVEGEVRTLHRQSNALRYSSQMTALRNRLIDHPLRSFRKILPADIRVLLGGSAPAQTESMRKVLQTSAAQERALPARRSSWSKKKIHGNILDEARPGDTLVVLGAPWFHQNYSTIIGEICRRNGLKFGLLVSDIIPLRRPEYFEIGLARDFSRFMLHCIPLADRLFSISEATAKDIRLWTESAGIKLRSKPQVIPVGSRFSLPGSTAHLPLELEPANFVLFVSTIEARKNHRLAFYAWRRLLDEMPAERVPKLVFAGAVGWMVADLMRQIKNSNYLDGKIRIIENPDDATLVALYRGARFTIFPSRCEGWGLPVSESLAHGKVCIASGATAIPEAGGHFCLYHDPDNVTEAVGIYRRALEEPELIASLEKRIAVEWRPTPWSAAAQALLEALQTCPPSTTSAE